MDLTPALAAFAWAGLGVLVAFPMLKIFHLWMVDRTWSTPVALTVLVLTFSTFMVLFRCAGAGWAATFAVLLNLATAISPIIEQRSNRRALDEMLNEDMRRYQQAIARDPNNMGAHSFLADAYVERGLLAEAITEYETAIRLDHVNTTSEQHKLTRIKNRLAGMERKSIVVCPACQCDTPAENPTCRKCGASLRVGFIDWLRQPANYRTVFRMSMGFIVVFFLVGLVFSHLPSEVKGCVIMATLLVVGFYIFRALGER
jgi:hypothetical protein